MNNEAEIKNNKHNNINRNKNSRLKKCELEVEETSKNNIQKFISKNIMLIMSTMLLLSLSLNGYQYIVKNKFVEKIREDMFNEEIL